MTDAQTQRAADGEAPVRHIFRWDLDKTYLRTEFDTVRDLIRTALQAPEEKVNVPGAVALLRELTRDHDGGRALVTFVSRSPSQMRKTLERKFEIDGIRPDAFILKPTLRNILKGRFRAVRGQVGYKLDALLRLRMRAPSAPETLFGDDAEQDAFIYSLYADLAAGRVGREDLVAILDEAQVYESTAEAILARFEDLRVEDNVDRIFIHLDRHTAPGRFWVFGPRLVPITNYFQAAVVLYADGVMGPRGLVRVADEMIEGNGYGIMELANSLQDLARRRHVDMAVFDRLAEQWKGVDDHDALPPDFLERLIGRVKALAPRVQHVSREWEGPVDYLEVLRADRKMRERVQPDSGLFS
ncbi:MAG: phosphatase domain-containing protein [Persicimonas sp.]